MPTVLVPLNETAFAESILPDAEQLAGPGGRFVLVYVATHGERVSDLERYFSNEAQLLQSRGFQVVTRVLVGGDIPRAIDEGVTELGAEMAAVATHGTAHGGRLARSSIAWKTLAHSPVPNLLRHAQEGRVRDLDETGPEPITIMVPLDGSPRAEKALSVAAALATRWEGSLVLTHSGDDATEGQAYLDRIAQNLTVPVQTVLGHGKPGEALARLAGEHAVTHVVMTSHGRTGLSRVIAGDVAAQLIDRLSLPIIVVPALAELAQQPEQRSQQEMAPAPAGLPTVG
jgi:nucleotide-binding universal stress UspA family protein